MAQQPHGGNTARGLRWISTAAPRNWHDGAMQEDTAVVIQLHQRQDYRFEVRFQSGGPTLLTDAPAPLGAAAGPNAEELLLAAVADCLSASLLFSLRKYKNVAVALRSQARATLARNEQGRLRVAAIEVEIDLGAPAASFKLLERALDQFEDFCVVSQSVRAGIPLQVRVIDGDGRVLK